jgi:hypothetical protein
VNNLSNELPIHLSQSIDDYCEHMETKASRLETKIESLQKQNKKMRECLIECEPYISQSWADVEYGDIDNDVNLVKEKVRALLKELE